MTKELQLEELFIRSSKTAKLLPVSTDNDDLLCLYGYYKQATIGDCNVEQPRYNIFDIKPYKKWEAWNKNKGMKKKEAMNNYINTVSIMINK